MVRAMTTYDVDARRDGDTWLAEVPALPGAHTWGRSLAGLRRAVREVIMLMTGLPDSAVDDESAFDVRWRFQLSGRLGEEVAEATELRSQLRVMEHTARDATARAARDLHDHGVSYRDSAEILGVSYQRVQQLVSA
jgi:predicted RNase H-like HicB family nuclease